jgi:hypothetical protein
MLFQTVAQKLSDGKLAQDSLYPRNLNHPLVVTRTAAHKIRAE